ncbi:Uncharacterized protein QJS10_CPA10g00059 [Acorus calamus]|uniref:Mitochondrial glycoprotein n=1 Tax=Acorus calamus TaxID=4465 RepID=A0AAV9DZB1_ACOCL|nr:Uncharacterized protein QJS10_CPA10g00059 [Acorus calamus]
MASHLLRRTIRSSLLQPKQLRSLIHSLSLVPPSPSPLRNPARVVPPSPPHHFVSLRSAHNKVGADENLRKVLDSEISCADEVEGHDQKPVAAGELPFEIVDNPGENLITLRREFSGERIEATVYMPEHDEWDGQEEEDDNTDDKDDDESDQQCISIILKIHKKTGTLLEFNCTARSNEITIDQLTMKPDGEDSDDADVYRPKFSDLDEKLQDSLYRYLEERGVQSSLFEFLREYMTNKDEREYLHWLKNIKGFIEH